MITLTSSTDSFRSTRRRLRTVVLSTAVLAVCAGLPASASADRLLSVGCVDSHRSHDDPIGGKDHLHEYTGSWSTSNASTLESMRASGHTCELDGDTAGYWTPALFNGKGELIRKRFSAAYYVASQLSDKTKVAPYPAGLKIVTDMSENKLSGWHCGQAGNNTELSATVIPNCKGKDDGPGGSYPDVTLLEAKIVFPDCWDGKNLDTTTPDGKAAENPVTGKTYPNDHRSHMTYSDVKKNCPADHPIHVPRLNLKNVYDTYGDYQNGKSAITLSSGAPATMHADFWNTWDQDIFAKSINYCLNGIKPSSGKVPPCGKGPTTLENPNYPNPTPPGAPLLPGQTAFKWPPPASQDKARIALRNVSDGDKISGPITIKAESLEKVAIARVEFVVDAEPQPVKNSSTPILNTPAFVANHEPYLFPLNTACLKNGKHTIDAEAVGITGRRGQPVPQITITTNNAVAAPPEDCLTDPDGDMGGMPEMPPGGGMPGGDMTPPDAPMNLVATPDPSSSTAIDLMWEASMDSDVDHYNVLRDGKVINQTAQTSYHDSGLSPNRTYTYTVQAVDTAGNPSVESNMADAVTTGSDSSAPEVTISGPGSDAVSGEVRLTAEARVPPSTKNGENISKVEFRVGGDLQRTDSSAPYTLDLDTRKLHNGANTISARAYDKSKPTPEQGTATITIDVLNPDTTKPSTPKNLKATAMSATTVGLSWDASTDPGANATGIKYYDVLRNGKVLARDSCTRDVPDETECTSTTYLDSGLSGKTRYKYAIQAVDRSGNRSSSSSSKSVTTK